MVDILFLFCEGWKQIRKKLSLINVMFLSGIREKLLFSPHSSVHCHTSHSAQTSSPQKRALKTDRLPPVLTQTAHDTVGQGLALPAQRTTPKWPFTPQIQVLRVRQTKRATSNTISCSSVHLWFWIISGEQQACICTALERHSVCNLLISFFSFLITFSPSSFSCSTQCKMLFEKFMGIAFHNKHCTAELELTAYAAEK